MGRRYLEDCTEAKKGLDNGDRLGVGFDTQTCYRENEEHLWKNSLRIVGTEYSVGYLMQRECYFLPCFRGQDGFSNETRRSYSKILQST